MGIGTQQDIYAAYVKAGCEFRQANLRLREASRAAQDAAVALAAAWEAIPLDQREDFRSPKEVVQRTAD